MKTNILNPKSAVFAAVFFLLFLAGEVSCAEPSFGTDVRVDDSDLMRMIYNPDIAVDNAGYIYTVWEDDRNFNDFQTDILFSKSTDNGATFSANLTLTDNVFYTINLYPQHSLASPSVAVDNAGNIYVAAALRKAETGSECIYFTKSTDGGDTFSAWSPISDNYDPGGASYEQGDPDITVDRSGTIYVVWHGERDGYPDEDTNIYFDKSADGGATWGADVKVDDYPAGTGVFNERQSGASLFVDDIGDIHVSWSDPRSYVGGYLYYSKSTDGGATFGSDVEVCSIPGGSASPNLGVDEDSDIYVVWDSSMYLDPSNFNVYFNKSTDGGATFPSSTFKFINDGGIDSMHSAMSMDSSGNIYAVWNSAPDYQTSGAMPDIYFSYSTDGGDDFSASAIVDDPISPADRRRSDSNITVGNDGRIYIVFAGYAWDDGAEIWNDPRLYIDVGTALPVPQIPEPISPTDGEEIHTLTPTFEWSRFQDGGDGATRWGQQLRIYNSATAALVHDTSLERSGSGYNWTIGEGILSWDTEYYWEVRYKDSNGHWSGWSTDASGGRQTFTAKRQYTLTVKKAGSGTGTIKLDGDTITPTHAKTYMHGEIAHLEATYVVGSGFTGWNGDITSGDNVIDVTMDRDKTVIATFPKEYTLTVDKAGSGDGEIAFDGWVIWPFPNESTHFDGTSVTLEATAGTGSAFTGWSGDRAAPGPVIEIYMDGDISVTGTFLKEYTLTVKKAGSGTGTVKLDGTAITQFPHEEKYLEGQVATLEATAAAGNGFAGWTGDTTSSNARVTVQMTGDRALIATFEKEYTLMVDKAGNGNGTVKLDGTTITLPHTATYLDGEEAGLEATEAADSLFDGWGGDVTSADRTIAVTMDEDKTVTVYFLIYYVLRVEKTGSGDGGVKLGGTPLELPYQGLVIEYDEVALEATASDGSGFAGWSGDVTSNNPSILVSMNSDKNITAEFLRKYTLTVNTAGSGEGTVTLDGAEITQFPHEAKYLDGAIATLEATPAAGNRFAGWTGDVTSSNSTMTVQMTGDRALTATFKKEYTLTVNKVGDAVDLISLDGVFIFEFPHTETYTDGDIATLEAAPAAGNGFAGWTGGVTNPSYRIDIPMIIDISVTGTFLPEYTLTVNTAGSGTGTVELDSTAITQFPHEETYLDGDIATFEATAVTGSGFTGWSGEVTSSNNTITVQMAGDKTVTATFLREYILRVDQYGGGIGTIKLDGTSISPYFEKAYLDGDIATLEVTEAPGSDFTRWSGDVDSADTTITVTMDSDKNVTVNLHLLFTLRVNQAGSGAGTIKLDNVVITLPHTKVYHDVEVAGLEAVPDYRNEFTGWTGDVVDDSSSILIYMTSDKSVTATFMREYTLTVTQAGSGIGTVKLDGTVITPPHEKIYLDGDIATLEATAAAGNGFDGWTGDVTSSNSTMTVQMAGDRSLTANFEKEYTLTVNQTGSGTGTITLDGTAIAQFPHEAKYLEGQVATLEATPAAGSGFLAWSGDVVSSSARVIVQMTGDRTLTATILKEYTLTVNQAGDGYGQIAVDGTIIKSPHTQVYFETETANLKASILGTGSVFTGWTGDVISQNEQISIPMVSDITVTGTFMREYTLTVNKAGSGTGTVELDSTAITQFPHEEKYLEGQVATLEATAAAGSGFAGWSGDTTSSNARVTVQMTGDRALTATFKKEYTLTVNKAGIEADHIYLDDEIILVFPHIKTYVDGAIANLEAAPAAGNGFAGWSGDVTSEGELIEVPMASDKNVTATFLKKYTLTVNKTGGGTGEIKLDGDTIILFPHEEIYLEGDIATLEATAAAGSGFLAWSGDVVSSSARVIVQMTGDRTLTATILKEYTLTVKKAGSGSGTIKLDGIVIAPPPSHTEKYLDGVIATLEVKADVGSRFFEWRDDATGSSPTITMPMTGDKTVKAVFKKEYTLEVQKSGGGSGTITLDGTAITPPHEKIYLDDDTATLEVTAVAGSVFTGWSGDAAGTNRRINVAMTGRKTVNAKFELALTSCFISATPTSGNSPLTVDLEAIVTGDIRNYWWDFGDGTVDTDVRTLPHIYNNAGVYVVRLKVRDSSNFELWAVPVVIKVDFDSLPTPYCAIVASIAEGDGPLTVNFDAITRGNLTHYWWDFGDDTVSTDAPVVTHIYNHTGVYIVRLTVREQGTFAEAQAIPVAIWVNPDQIPDPAAYIVASTNSGTSPLTVDFKAITNGTIRKFWWDFGDGAEETTDIDTVSHEYTQSGIHIAKLTVRDDNMNIAHARPVPIWVDPDTVPTPFCKIAAVPTRGDLPLTVKFEAVTNGAIRRYWWKFGDGNEATDIAAPTHIYSSAGIYVVNLKARDANSKETDSSIAIIVDPDSLPEPSCAIVASPARGDDPLTVNFDAALIGDIRKYWWDFGDNTPVQNACPVTHRYDTPGVYIVRLSVRDVNMNMAEAEPVAIYVDPDSLPQPSCYIQASKLGGAAPLTVNFKALIVGGSMRKSWWDFGDDTGARNVDVYTHTYNTPGLYTVNLTVRTTDGDEPKAAAIQIDVR